MATQGAGDGHPQVEDPEAERAEWLGQLNALASQVRTWVEKAGWRTRLVSKPTRDGVLSRFEVPLLLMERDGVQIALNPVSRFSFDTKGIVDLYVVPAYDEVANLYLMDEGWELAYQFVREGSTERQDVVGYHLAEEPLLRVLDEMARCGA